MLMNTSDYAQTKRLVEPNVGVVAALAAASASTTALKLKMLPRSNRLALKDRPGLSFERAGAAP
jgi:hypothetical protein